MTMLVIGLARVGESGGHDDFSCALLHKQRARGGGLRGKRRKNHCKRLDTTGHDEGSRK